MCSYLTQWYRLRLREYEGGRLSVEALGNDDPAIVKEYAVHYDGSDQLLEEILGGAPPRLGDPLEIIEFAESIYEPLFYVSNRDTCAIVPTSLVKSERDFVHDVIRFVGDGGLNESKAALYVLRNASRGRGIGFAEAENFHPDFLMWFCRGETQVIMFVEPHGLAHESLGFASPKVAFAKTVRKIEARLGDPSLRLSASIISPTPRANVKWASDATASELEEHNLFFFEDPRYIVSLMRRGLDLLSEGTCGGDQHAAATDS